VAYKLYGRANAGSSAVEALLTLLSVDFEFVDVLKQDDGAPPDWYRALNPRGEVPALMLPDGTVMTESAAMMIYLADAHGDGQMAPQGGAVLRAHYLRWISYLSATVYSTMLRVYYSERFSSDAAHAAAVNERAVADLDRDFAVFTAGLGDGPFVLGNTMSALDLYAAMLISWTPDVDRLFARETKLKRLYEAVSANEKVRKVWDRNGMR
jgi:glutathione S-transferase